jgi:hypothetical protein
MKHDWEHLQQTVANYIKYGGPARVCRNCGKTQTKESETWWGRVVGYSWQPLVGRCSGKKSKSKASEK